MTTPKKRKKTERTRAPGGTSGDIDRDVDESPDAVEHRREAQSGPGATGVSHTGANPEHVPTHIGAGSADNPAPVPGHRHIRHTDDADDDAREAMEDEIYARAGDEANAEEQLDDDELDLHEPDRDKIDPHIRHER